MYASLGRRFYILSLEVWLLAFPKAILRSELGVIGERKEKLVGPSSVCVSVEDLGE